MILNYANIIGIKILISCDLNCQIIFACIKILYLFQIKRQLLQLIV